MITPSPTAPLPRLSSTVAVVTGGSRGIGLAIAAAFVERGARVVITGREQRHLDEAAGRFSVGTVLAVRADVGKPEDVKNLFAETKKAFGRLDFLFNNAGFGAPAIPMEELTLQQWQSVVDTILTGSFLCTQEAIKIMKSQTPKGGRMKAGVPQASGEVRPEAVFDVEHCGSAIRYMASLPLDTNVLFMNIKATKMPFEGRG